MKNLSIKKGFIIRNLICIYKITKQTIIIVSNHPNTFENGVLMNLYLNEYCPNILFKNQKQLNNVGIWKVKKIKK